MQELIEQIRTKNKFPIFILSSPRSGSTVLLDSIASVFTNLRSFNEPDQSVEAMEDFVQFVNQSKQYIVKIHSSHLYSNWKYTIRYPKSIVDKLTNESGIFRISTVRKDIISQIASYYIASVRGIWGYDLNTASKIETTDLNYDYSLIDDAINSIKYCYSLSEHCPFIDYSLSYEDIQSNNVTTTLVKTPAPNNYIQLLSIIQDRYNVLKKVKLNETMEV